MGSFAEQLLAVLKTAAGKLEAEGSVLVDTARARIAVLEPMLAADVHEADAAAHSMVAELLAAAEGK